MKNKTSNGNTWNRPTLLDITNAIIEMGDATMGEIISNRVFSDKRCLGKQIPAVKFFFHFVDGRKIEALAYNENGSVTLNW